MPSRPTPLHQACADGNAEEALRLISVGSDLNARDEKGRTALHYVADRGLDAVAVALLDAGADLDIADSHGNQPLWTATFEDKGFGRRLGMIALFLERGADADHKNNVGKAPRDIPIIADYPDVAALYGRYRSRG